MKILIFSLLLSISTILSAHEQVSCYPKFSINLKYGDISTSLPCQIFKKYGHGHYTKKHQHYKSHTKKHGHYVDHYTKRKGRHKHYVEYYDKHKHRKHRHKNKHPKYKNHNHDAPYNYRHHEYYRY